MCLSFETPCRIHSHQPEESVPDSYDKLIWTSRVLSYINSALLMRFSKVSVPPLPRRSLGTPPVTNSHQLWDVWWFKFKWQLMRVFAHLIKSALINFHSRFPFVQLLPQIIEPWHDWSPHKRSTDYEKHVYEPRVACNRDTFLTRTTRTRRTPDKIAVPFLQMLFINISNTVS